MFYMIDNRVDDCGSEDIKKIVSTTMEEGFNNKKDEFIAHIKREIEEDILMYFSRQGNIIIEADEINLFIKNSVSILYGNMNIYLDTEKVLNSDDVEVVQITDQSVKDRDLKYLSTLLMELRK